MGKKPPEEEFITKELKVLSSFVALFVDIFQTMGVLESIHQSEVKKVYSFAEAVDTSVRESE